MIADPTRSVPCAYLLIDADEARVILDCVSPGDPPRIDAGFTIPVRSAA